MIIIIAVGDSIIVILIVFALDSEIYRNIYISSFIHVIFPPYYRGGFSGSGEQVLPKRCC